jgi:hypothetical protein
MKRHYEMMRIMRTKVVDHRDHDEAADSIYCVHDAIDYRIQDLASASVSSSTLACFVNLLDQTTGNFRQQKLDPEKQFDSFAYGIVSSFSPGQFCLLTHLL